MSQIVIKICIAIMINENDDNNDEEDDDDSHRSFSTPPK